MENENIDNIEDYHGGDERLARDIAEGFRRSPILTARSAFVLYCAILIVTEKILNQVGSSDTKRQRVSLLPDFVGERTHNWWLRLVTCAADLTEDIEDGQTPEPQCVGEDVIMYLALRKLRDTENPESLLSVSESNALRHIPVRKADYDWNAIEAQLLDDDDMALVEALGDGAAVPQEMLPENWFRWFSERLSRPSRYLLAGEIPAGVLLEDDGGVRVDPRVDVILRGIGQYLDSLEDAAVFDSEGDADLDEQLDEIETIRDMVSIILGQVLVVGGDEDDKSSIVKELIEESHRNRKDSDGIVLYSEDDA